MSLDRVVVLTMVLLGIGAGTVLPILRARAKTGGTGLTFQQPRRDAWERFVGTVVGAVGAGHLAWGPLYAIVGPGPLGVVTPPAWLFWSGVAGYLASLVLVVQAQRTMGRSWRIGIDKGTTSLVTEGVYSVVRNPIYVGAIGCGWSMLAISPSWITFGGALVYLVFIQFQARLEERHLGNLHGASYRRYVDSVGRFLPLPSRTLSRSERSMLARFAEAVVPGGETIPKAGEATVDHVQAALDEGPAVSSYLVRYALRGIELAALMTRATRFSRLPLAAREETLGRWLTSAPGLSRHALRGLVALVKTSHFDAKETAAATKTRVYAPVAVESPRWLAQMTDGIDVKDDDTLECDVVVVGTGAGGAPLAYELAAKGHAVLLIEEGRWFGRHELVGRASEARKKMFRDGGQTLAIGNVLMPIWTGVTVGGSTTINSGTCYRTPPRILARWRDELGLDAFTDAAMAPHFARVEEILGVAPTEEKLLGGGARRAASGLDELGWAHHAILRNAPGCDGQGRCMFGCPTGAKRSTNESYVPMALEKGAQLLARTRAARVTIEGGRATGIVARTEGGGAITVKARATVLAGGALMTPMLLLEQGIANGSGMVGRNLSVHPAAPILARFEDRIAMQENVPQSWAIEQFASDGVMIEESGNPPEVVAVALPFVGKRFVETIEAYDRISTFGAMIEDTSRGRVTRARGGKLSISYSMNEEDVRRLARGVAATAEMFLAAGAEVVFPAVRGFDRITDDAGLAELRAARLAPGDFALSAVHPLGTARMGNDPRTSVIGPSHETHDVKDLFIVDGAAVPTALGVNPQITIMAMAHRAAEKIHERL
jgi:choline dehydrogenase-like flavoprotein/protein-S-isoprenylcysteine O-methyltransferase Ste14